MLNLAPSPQQYDKSHQDQVQRALEVEDKKNIKNDTVLNSFRMKDTATGVVKTVKITSGAFVIS